MLNSRLISLDILVKPGARWTQAIVVCRTWRVRHRCNHSIAPDRSHSRIGRRSIRECRYRRDGSVVPSLLQHRRVWYHRSGEPQRSMIGACIESMDWFPAATLLPRETYRLLLLLLQPQHDRHGCSIRTRRSRIKPIPSTSRLWSVMPDF